MEWVALASAVFFGRGRTSRRGKHRLYSNIALAGASQDWLCFWYVGMEQHFMRSQRLLCGRGPCRGTSPEWAHDVLRPRSSFHPLDVRSICNPRKGGG